MCHERAQAGPRRPHMGPSGEGHSKMSRLFDLAMEACDEAGEARILGDALRGLDSLDLETIDGEHADAITFVLLDAIAGRLHAMADRLDERCNEAQELKEGAEI